MLRFAVGLLSLSLLAVDGAAGTQDEVSADSLPSYIVSDASAPEVTAANLLASERFWPYQAALVESYTAAGASRAIHSGALGVVIRVEREARVRIDFGRDGLVTLPLRATDLLRRANEIRTGTVKKSAPNLTYAITPRLLEGEAEVIRRVRLEDSFGYTGFLCFFADPNAASFPKLAGLLAPLSGRDGVLPVLFAQGEHPDILLARKLNAAGWKGAFALDHMSEAYTRTLVDGPIEAPTLALYSAEGRVIWSGAFPGAIPPELEQAWAEVFPAKL